MKKTHLFLVFLSLQIVSIVGYTFIAFMNDGANLFPIFIDNILSLKWNGQFNLDFSCYLILSGLWIMWRNKFSSYSMILGLIAMIMGYIVFAPYLLYLIVKEKGNLNVVATGNN